MTACPPLLQLDDPVDAVPGVGPVRARALGEAGILTVEDLLLHLPFRYEDRSGAVPIAELVAGEPACVAGRVTRCRRSGPPGRRSRVEAEVADDTGTLRVVWFNQPYMADVLSGGQQVLLWGRPGTYKDALQLSNPAHEVQSGEEAPAATGSPHFGRPVPVHRRVGVLGPAALRRLVDTVLAALAHVPEVLPPRVAEATGLMPRGQALREVHYPAPGSDLEAWNDGRSEAHRRLVMQEFVAFQTALRLQRQLAARDVGIGRQLGPQVRARVEAVLPFALTAAQRGALDEIWGDLSRPRAMHRLLQGDVGSGKTAVAACALLAVALVGDQAALLAPTGILAEQLAAHLRSWATPLELDVELLTGAASAAVRRRVGQAARRPAPCLFVGTHALLEPAVEFARLGLVVIDEQHRFGVAQRAALRDKGRRQGAAPDLLVMTATPIPRSLALTLYSDLEVSRIGEPPPGRIPVATEVRTAGEWADVLGAIAATAAAGQRAFVVAPRIEQRDDEVGSAVALHQEISAALDGVPVGLVHGDLDAAAKERAMRDFVTGATRVLVATTVVEVGVDVPEATLMVVDHAERFGLAQLHQLRGRVGRGRVASRCVLVAHPPLSPTAASRLRMLEDTNDGFRLAEADLKLRGAGDVLGTRQTGAFELRVGDPFAHPDWLQQAHDIARGLATGTDVQSRRYREQLRAAWRRRMQLARAG